MTGAFTGVGPIDVVFEVETPEGPRFWRNVCPHTGGPLASPDQRPLSRDGQHLVCATHGALFRVTDGLCIAGPCAGRSLTSASPPRRSPPAAPR